MMRFLLAFLLCLPTFAADTGWVIANAGATVAGADTDWTSPSNVTADDGTHATSAPPGLGNTDPLRATFALTIPVGATINGVEVRYQAARGNSGPKELSVRLVVGGSAVGADRSVGAIYTILQTNYDRGGAADLWSTTITRDQAVAMDFGFQFSTTDSDTGSDTMYCDVMWIKVTYTEAAAPATGGFPVTFLEVE